MAFILLTSWRVLLIWFMYLPQDIMWTLHLGHSLNLTISLSSWDFIQLSKNLKSNKWPQSSSSTYFTSSFPDNLNFSSKLRSLGEHNLQTWGHFKPHIPMQGCPHLRVKGQRSSQGILLQGSEHLLVHLECIQPISHCSKQRMHGSLQFC